LSRPDVQALFDRIAPNYDAMNERISYGRHRAWKRRLARDAATCGHAALDLCCGTGDIPLLLLEEGFTAVTGLDFSEAMLAVAAKRLKDKPVTLMQADANAPLPFPDGRFDTVTISFGLRNLGEPAAALAECRRVLTDGGRLYVLDACRPQGIVAKLVYGLQYRLLFPLITRKNRADYDWLRRSSEGFWTPKALSQAATDAGLRPISARTYAFGLALYQRFERATP
jgi:demethylmenaquinone methyltransferase/2-methoxy-6-polyprenyl-1,4-benzoquinol methylase